MNVLPHKIIFSLLLVLLQSGGISRYDHSFAASGDRGRVALLPFELRGLSAEDGLRLKNGFASGLAESKRFDVISDIVLKNNLEQAGLTNIDSCDTPPSLAQLGTILNVEKVVHVQAERWEQRFMLHIQLIRASDAALLYDERVDYSGDINTLTSIIAPEQGRKLAAAFLDKKPNWWLIGAGILVGLGLIYWLFTTFGSRDSSVTEGNKPIGPQA